MARERLASKPGERSASDLDAWLRVERLEYVRLGDRLAVVRLLARLGPEAVPPSGAKLIVERGGERTLHSARGCRVERARRPRLLGGELLWRACFAIPLDVVEYPTALFQITAPGRAALALPVPDLRLLTVPHTAPGRAISFPSPMRRGLVVVATTLVITGSTSGVAMAATGSNHSAAGGDSFAPHGTRVGLVAGRLDPATTHGANPMASTAPRRAPATHPGLPARVPLYGLGPDPTPQVGEPSGGPSGEPSGGPSITTVSGGHQAHHRPARRDHRTGHPSGGASIDSPVADRRRDALHETLPPVASPISSAGTRVVGQSPVSSVGIHVAGQGQGAAATAWSRLSTLMANGDRPPAFLIPIYKAAGHRYHVPWPVLAAINSIETDYGRDVSTSSAGAIGWMQFMPATWAEYGVAAGRHSRPDPYDPRDAIFSAARYLAANGAAHHLRKAIFAYNHATWYVDEVLWSAASIASHTPAPGSRVRAKLDAMQEMAEAVDGEPYIWGGGHSGWGLAPGYDCSGFVSTVLHAAGYLQVPATTQTLPSQPEIFAGPGRYVTIFDRTDGGAADDDHVIIDINGRWWESGGSSGAGGAPSVHRITGISASYLLTFNEILHPRGL